MGPGSRVFRKAANEPHCAVDPGAPRRPRLDTGPDHRVAVVAWVPTLGGRDDSRRDARVLRLMARTCGWLGRAGAAHAATTPRLGELRAMARRDFDRNL